MFWKLPARSRSQIFFTRLPLGVSQTRLFNTKISLSNIDPLFLLSVASEKELREHASYNHYRNFLKISDTLPKMIELKDQHVRKEVRKILDNIPIEEKALTLHKNVLFWKEHSNSSHSHLFNKDIHELYLSYIFEKLLSGINVQYRNDNDSHWKDKYFRISSYERNDIPYSFNEMKSDILYFPLVNHLELVDMFYKTEDDKLVGIKCSRLERNEENFISIKSLKQFKKMTKIDSWESFEFLFFPYSIESDIASILIVSDVDQAKNILCNIKDEEDCYFNKENMIEKSFFLKEQVYTFDIQFIKLPIKV